MNWQDDLMWSHHILDYNSEVIFTFHRLKHQVYFECRICEEMNELSSDCIKRHSCSVKYLPTVTKMFLCSIVNSNQISVSDHVEIINMFSVSAANTVTASGECVIIIVVVIMIVYMVVITVLQLTLRWRQCFIDVLPCVSVPL